jgi:hypothetical protein
MSCTSAERRQVAGGVGLWHQYGPDRQEVASQAPKAGHLLVGAQCPTILHLLGRWEVDEECLLGCAIRWWSFMCSGR